MAVLCNGPAADHLDNAQGLTSLALVRQFRAGVTCLRSAVGLQSGGVRWCSSFEYGFRKDRDAASHAAQAHLSILQDVA